MRKRNITLAIVITVIIIGGGIYLVMNPVSIPTEKSEEIEEIKISPCGSSVTFTYKGNPVTYGIVEHNNMCWLDRNLGASRVATVLNDASAYGDYFQWGRLDDGHQASTSGENTILSISDEPGHSNFIYGMDNPYDWRSSPNNNLWQGISGINNPCPNGWRLPTSAEWNVERLSWSSNDSAGAFASPLKLTVPGFRHHQTAHFTTIGSYGYYWSSTVSGVSIFNLGLYTNGTSIIPFHRAFAFSVRCLKEK